MEGLRTQVFGNHARESSLGIVEKKLAERSDLIKAQPLLLSLPSPPSSSFLRGLTPFYLLPNHSSSFVFLLFFIKPP